MSTWQEKALEAVAEHEFTDDTTQDTYGRDIERVGCLCGGWQWGSNDHECHERWWDHVIAALAPVVEAEVRRGQAEALREAAAAVMPFDGRTREAKALTQWLRDRAAAIEAGDPR